MSVIYLIVFILILLSGLFSGLTLGLMSLNQFDLHRKVKLGNKDAIKIYPLRKQGNLLLVTLLLGNVAVNSTLAVFLGSITTGVLAGILSTALIVIFGEILPQSIFSRHALWFGARTTPLVYAFLYTFYPIAKPIALLLDKLLGGELPTIFSKQEFRVLLEEQQKHKRSDIKHHTYEILKGGLVFSEKHVKDVMTKKNKTFFISSKEKITRSFLSKVKKHGHSRMPVYNTLTKRCIGILYTKDLINVDPLSNISVKAIMRKEVHRVKETDKLDAILNDFKAKKTHLFLVLDRYKNISGIVTLEDVLEEIVGEIIDEYDMMVDMRVVN